MEAAKSTETSVSCPITIQCHNPENHDLNSDVMIARTYEKWRKCKIYHDCYTDIIQLLFNPFHTVTGISRLETLSSLFLDNFTVEQRQPDISYEFSILRKMMGFFLFATGSRPGLVSTQHPMQCVGGGVFPRGLIDPGVELTTHLHLVPRLRIRGAIPPFSQYVFMAWCLVNHRNKFNVN
jgi:hypothetical protein